MSDTEAIVTTIIIVGIVMTIFHLMRRPAPSPTHYYVIGAPRIGAAWPTQGGINAGTSRGEDGAPDAHLIFAQAQPGKDLTYQGALDYAKACREGGFDDWHIASRYEASVLYAHLHDVIPKKWHWTSTQHAGSSDWAWCQNFGDGNQDRLHKSLELPALLVRRVPIQ